MVASGPSKSGGRYGCACCCRIVLQAVLGEMARSPGECLPLLVHSSGAPGAAPLVAGAAVEGPALVGEGELAPPSLCACSCNFTQDVLEW